MRYTKTLLMAALAVAAVFLTSEAFAQWTEWSDGGPEMYQLTYPPETAVMESGPSATEAHAKAVQTADALTVWSDGGPEMYALTYPPKTTPMEREFRMAETPNETARPDMVSALLWSDGGPEEYESSAYPPESATMESRFRLSELLGETVRNEDRRDLGSVDDLLISENGRIKYVFLDQGGILGRGILGRGIGDELYAVPWRAFDADPKDKMLTLNVSSDKLEMAPTFKRDEWARIDDSEFEEEVHGYYGVEEGMESPLMIFGEDGTFQANSFMGVGVYDVNGLEIGRVYDFVADEEGRVEYVVVKHGGTRLLGIGSMLTPVPFEAATLNPFDHTITINIEKDRFVEAPMIEGNNWGRFDNAQWGENIQEYFE